jgi:hypothetical protein
MSRIVIVTLIHYHHKPTDPIFLLFVTLYIKNRIIMTFKHSYKTEFLKLMLRFSTFPYSFKFSKIIGPISQ